MIANHGQIAFEDNLAKAFELAEEVENISLQYITSLKLGKPKILSFKEMNKSVNSRIMFILRVTVGIFRDKIQALSSLLGEKKRPWEK